MDDERFPENERLQIEQIRELEMEELQVEVVDDVSSDDNSSEHGDDQGFTFNTSLASLHTYLGDVEDTRGRLAFLEGDAIVNLPMLYLEGVVLFPEATLPLTVVQRSFKASVETAMNSVDAPYTIGVVHLHRHRDDNRMHVAKIGTTAEIRQFRKAEDGSLKVVTRGRQRFHLRRHWIDVEGVPWAEVKIIQEDMPLRTPKDAFGQLASIGNLVNCSYSHVVPSESSCVKQKNYEELENDRECMSDSSIDGSGHSLTEMRMRQSSIDSSDGYRSIDESMSSDEYLFGSGHNLERSFIDYSGGSQQPCMGDAPSIVKEDTQGRQTVESKWLRKAPRSFWPYWVYRMYDSYFLARRVSDMWRQIIGVPSLDGLVKMPDLLSFYIGSKIPVSESARQELLEINGVSYRLRKEIQLLEHFDLIRCKTCLTMIAKRTDMVVMSSDGPHNAYANPHGYVHSIITVSNANGLSLHGFADKRDSWFPGYAWTIAECASCGKNIGWLFTAIKKKLRPRSFWGIRSVQVAEF